MDSQLDRFYRAWCAPELELLGFTLAQPYCLGMALLLSAIDSPFAHLDEEREIGPRELLVALQLCAEAKFPFRYVNLSPDPVEITRLEQTPSEFKSAALTFVTWVRECSGRPEYWEDEGEEAGPSLTAPHLLAQAVSIMRKLSLSEERVWSMPLGVVAWYQGTIAEQEGASLRFFNDSDIDEGNNPPDLSKLSDEEQFEYVRQQQGDEFAQGWLARRKEAACRE